MSYLKILFVALVLIAAVSCKNKKPVLKEKPPVMVDVIVAKYEDYPNNIEVNGTVLSEEMIELHPEISGRLVYLNIPDGETVKEGTVLAKINDADLQAQLEQLKAQLDLAIKTEQRLKKLLDVNGINQADYDAASNQVITIQAGIKLLNAQIDKTVIRAAFTGELGLRLVSPGAYVTPQTLIGTLQVINKVKIDFTVPETYANLVSLGKTVNVITGSIETKLPATIIAVEPQINISTRNLKIRARLNSGTITPGSFVKVVLNDNGKGIVIPSDAVIPDAYSDQAIVIKNGKGVFRKVITGIRTADVIEIKKGINPGDTVVVSGVLFVRPNAKVKIKSQKLKVKS